MSYQRLARSGNVLVAARGSQIDSFSLQDGSLLSTWSPQSTEHPSTVPTQQTTMETAGAGDSPPAKKRKLSSVGQDAAHANNRCKAKETRDTKMNGKPKAVVNKLETPAVVVLTAATDGRHVIAITGEDKSLRVFEHQQTTTGAATHSLTQISLRQMPKRPCSVRVTSDNLTIISADKFGDVYSLPLLPIETSPTVSPEPQTTEATKSFIPAANELTIHSLRNRRALENQRRLINKTPEKSDALFEHTILLGHVSLLTDVILADLDKRSYILTADRDEHIRISRGVPQSHVIEGFCLGHTEFITRLCIPNERSNVLISGGGDDELFVWEWQTRKLLSKFNLSTIVAEVQRKISIVSDEDLKITISGISHLRLVKLGTSEDLVLVTCEAVAALFVLKLTDDNKLAISQVLDLPGNPLDVIIYDAQDTPVTGQRVIVSIDGIRRPGSTKELRGPGDDSPSLLHVFCTQDGILTPADNPAFFHVREESDRASNGEASIALLYPLGSLRKREDESAKD